MDEKDNNSKKRFNNSDAVNEGINNGDLNENANTPEDGESKRLKAPEAKDSVLNDFSSDSEAESTEAQVERVDASIESGDAKQEHKQVMQLWNNLIFSGKINKKTAVLLAVALVVLGVFVFRSFTKTVAVKQTAQQPVEIKINYADNAVSYLRALKNCSFQKVSELSAAKELANLQNTMFYSEDVLQKCAAFSNSVPDSVKLLLTAPEANQAVSVYFQSKSGSEPELLEEFGTMRLDSKSGKVTSMIWMPYSQEIVANTLKTAKPDPNSPWVSLISTPAGINITGVPQTLEASKTEVINELKKYLSFVRELKFEEAAKMETASFPSKSNPLSYALLIPPALQFVKLESKGDTTSVYLTSPAFMFKWYRADMLKAGRDYKIAKEYFSQVPEETYFICRLSPENSPVLYNTTIVSTTSYKTATNNYDAFRKAVVNGETDKALTLLADKSIAKDMFESLNKQNKIALAKEVFGQPFEVLSQYTEDNVTYVQIHNKGCINPYCTLTFEKDLFSAAVCQATPGFVPTDGSVFSIIPLKSSSKIKVYREKMQPEPSATQVLELFDNYVFAVKTGNLKSFNDMKITKGVEFIDPNVYAAFANRFPREFIFRNQYTKGNITAIILSGRDYTKMHWIRVLAENKNGKWQLNEVTINENVGSFLLPKQEPVANTEVVEIVPGSDKHQLARQYITFRALLKARMFDQALEFVYPTTRLSDAVSYLSIPYFRDLYDEWIKSTYSILAVDKNKLIVFDKSQTNTPYGVITFAGNKMGDITYLDEPPLELENARAEYRRLYTPSAPAGSILRVKQEFDIGVRTGDFDMIRKNVTGSHYIAQSLDLMTEKDKEALLKRLQANIKNYTVTNESIQGDFAVMTLRAPGTARPRGTVEFFKEGGVWKLSSENWRR